MEKFDKAKKGRFLRIDKSSIKGWDKPIIELCNKINNNNDYFTTSSCSGRITLIKDNEKKQPGLFLFRSHEKVSFAELKKELEKALKETKGLVYFKQEPCLVVVSCRNLEKQQELLNNGRNLGYGKSGIISTNGKNIVELMSTENIIFPVINNEKVLVSDDFLKLILKESNKKLERCWEKIGKLKEII